MNGIFQSDLNDFAKKLNSAIPTSVEWREYSRFDEETWPKPNNYYWVIGITQNLDMELQWACEKRKFTTHESTKDGCIWYKFGDWTNMYLERIFETAWWAEVKEEIGNV